MKFIYSFFILIFSSSFVFSQEILSSTVLEKLSSAVYEVVVEKPKEDNIQYEKELPLQRIPFSIRDDKYSPIGTAFLMEDGKFYSAAHVIELVGKSLYTGYFIRDKDGKTFPIDKVEKFSTNRDFVVFSVKDFDVSSAEKLKIAPEQDLNTEIFSVGNALGEGIVIRNGIYTSQTFEEINGEWKWLRFSAAASPGNSGGPLVNKDGDVLGIITMKSQNENLNYALPFSETTKVPDNKGVLFSPSYYTMPNIVVEKFFTVYKYLIDLPKSVGDIQKEIVEYTTKSTLDLIENKVKSDYSFLGKKGFVKSDKYSSLKDTNYFLTFPTMMCIAENGEWDLYSPNDIEEFNIGTDGILLSGNILGYGLSYLKKSSEVSLQDLINNPKIYCDYLINASGLNRSIAGEQIKITSLGDPVKSESFIDSLDRKWFVNYWELTFADAVFMTVVLPVPEGMIILTKLDSTKQIYLGHNFDAKFMCDYIFPSYEGTLSEWQEFLSLSEEINSKYNVHDFVSIQIEKKQINFNCNEISLGVPNKILGEEEIFLCLVLGYAEKDGKMYLNPEGINAYNKGNRDDYFSVYITTKKIPNKNAPKNKSKEWQDMIARKGTFDGESYESDGYRYLNKIIKDEEKQLYLFSLCQTVEVTQKDFNNNAKMILKSSSIR